MLEIGLDVWTAVAVAVAVRGELSTRRGNTIDDFGVSCIALFLSTYIAA